MGSPTRPELRTLSKQEPTGHYLWGQHCEGWVFVDTDELSVKQERMPAGSAEVKHYHEKSQQFFYVLTGKAQFEIEDELIEVAAGQGLHIRPGIKHRIINKTGGELEFILCSQPSTKGDRLNCIQNEGNCK